ncbi:MAG: hypothetical protein L3K26_10920 [Candidatus Hydrogenedentes bacterium]|nr:hypothetical protein [Candidatus Hydrogenedentota bacterium]
MDAKRFGFGRNDAEGGQNVDAPSAASGSIDALEQWLKNNHHLWELGLQLATTARHYRHTYKHIPFNQSGWYSPN